MARYFFDLHESGRITVDHEGLDQSSLEAAEDYARRAAQNIMCEELERGQLCLSCRIEVRDATGLVLLTVPFGELVQITGEP